MDDDVSKRFWPKVQRGSPEECWPWTGNKNGAGYGMLRTKRDDGSWGKTLAHRLAFEDRNGPLPAGALVCHHCDNPICVNPAHLFAGDYRKNALDMVQKGRNRHGAPKRHPDGSLMHPPPILRGDAHPARVRPKTVLRGEAVGTAKLTEALVLDLWKRRMAGASFSDLARQFDLDASTAAEIARGERWSHLLGRDGAPTLEQLQAIPAGKSAKRLTADVVRAIRAESDAGKPDRAIAAERGISVMSVYEIRTRRAWKHLP